MSSENIPAHENFGSRMRQWCEEMIGNQLQVAVAIGTYPAAVSRYYSGKTVPGGEVLMRLAELGCNVTWLLTGTGDMFADNEAGRRLRADFDNGGLNHEGTSLTGPSTGYAKDLSSKSVPRSRGERSGKEQG